MAYAPGAVRTLSERDRARLLAATGARSATYRDHMLFALALGTGLRCHELLALDCGDVYNRRGGARTRIELRVYKRSPSAQTVGVTEGMRKKLDRLRSWKRHRGEGTEPNDPLFVSRLGRRLSKRRAREIFAGWRDELELPRRLSFHALRHTFCQRLYEHTGNLRLVQVAARHASLQSTTIYAAPSDESVLRAVSEID